MSLDPVELLDSDTSYSINLQFQISYLLFAFFLLLVMSSLLLYKYSPSLSKFDHSFIPAALPVSLKY